MPPIVFFQEATAQTENAMQYPEREALSFSPYRSHLKRKKNLRLVQRMPGDTIGPLRLRIGSWDSLSADVYDISIIGVGLIVDLPFPTGISFIVEGGPQGRGLPTTLTAELRHETQLALK